MKGSLEVWVEGVVNEGVDHRSAVLQPFEGRYDPFGDVSTASRARCADDVDAEERKIEDYEDGKEDAQHEHCPSTAVQSRCAP